MMLSLPEMVSGLIGKLSSIRSLGMKIYGSSKEWAQISEQLERRIILLGSESNWFNQPSINNGLLELLSERLSLCSFCLSLLESKVVELQMEKSGSKSSCCARPLFTNSKRIVQLYDFFVHNIQPMLQSLDDIPFGIFDFSYVHLPTAESAIAAAINNTKFSTIILHGRSGSGKSTIARYMALQYLEDARQSSLRFPDSSTLSLAGGHTPLFNRVFFLKCGPYADADNKHTEFLQLCWPNSSEDLDTLVLLDDVWSKYFLQKFVDLCCRSYRKIRYLVTSCNTDLTIENSLSVEIEVVPEEAIAILASHIGFPDNVIPDQLQDIADQVIKSVYASPSLLARFASEIRNKQFTDLAVWQEAELKLLTQLRQDETSPGCGTMGSPSAGSFLKLSLMSLSPAAQNLLLLISLCGKSSIPEDVVQVMYESSKLQWATTDFYQITTELQSRDWLTVTSEHCEWNDELSVMGRNSFSFSSLHLQIVRKVMKEKVDLLMCIIFGKDVEDGFVAKEASNEDVFMTILGAVFFDKLLYSNGIRVERASRLGIDMQKLGLETKSAIEPLLWLIPNKYGHNYDHTWDETTAFVAKKVILSYVCRNRVKESHMDHLLLMPFSRTATCWALVLMLGGRNRPIIDEEPSGTITTLVDFLAQKAYHIQLLMLSLSICSDQNLEVLLEVVRAFKFELTFSEELRRVSLKALDRLVQFLDADDNPGAQLLSARILAELAEEINNRELIMLNPVALKGLLTLLGPSGLSWQEKAEVARALANLCRDKSVARTVRDYPGAVYSLQFLRNQGYLPASEHAREALGYIDALMQEVGNTSSIYVFTKYPGYDSTMQPLNRELGTS